MTEKDFTFRGIVRKVDDLGRIVIPKEYRKVLGINEYDKVEMFLVEEGGVYLKKVEDAEEI